MIEKIATDVSNMLINSTPSKDFDGLVGMIAHMERMEQLLSLDLDEVRMIGIWGPPGIGKSTIARFLYHQFSSSFQLGAIMVNIKASYPRPCLDEYNAQLQLQNQMLAQVINQKDIMISHLGVAQERLKDKKVILVLDDVDRLEQLDALAKDIRWFGPGSRIIITTEDVRVFKAHRIKHIYKVNFPSSDEAFQIFCMNAFGQKHPDVGFFKLDREVMALAGKLPLGLKILGSYLRGMSKQEWKRTIPSLQTHLNGEIKSIIKISYDGLHDEDKELFLYIACLFNFKPRHRVEEILAKKFSNVRHGLDVLAEKSLISIEYGVIKMHDLLVLFGTKTYRKHGQLSVCERDIYTLLCEDTTDGRRCIGIDLYFSKTEEELNVSEKALESMSDLQFISIYGNGRDGVTRSERLHSLFYYSQKIRSLRWEYFQDICLPSTFNPEFLVQLVMCGSKLQRLWEGTKLLSNLKWMDLAFSRDLKELPDLSTATNLEELILQYCSSLEELPSSIGKLTSLQILDLSGCSSLLELPISLGSAINLQVLHLYWCSSLVKLPSSIENATNLEIMNLSNCSSLVKLPAIENYQSHEIRSLLLHNLVELPSIGNATKLEKLNLSNCSSLVKLPSSIENATNLTELNISNCTSLVELPSIGNATKLEELNLSNCSSLVNLPAIENATILQRLLLENCSSLLELPPSIGTAKNLWVSGCSSLVKLPSSIGDITNLRELNLSNCSSLVELPSSIGNLQNLQELTMCRCSKLEALPTNINLKSLYELDLTDCSQLKRFPEISTNIKYMNLIGTAIKEVPLSIMSWSLLFEFHMSYFESLKEFTELQLNEDIQEVGPWVKGMSLLRKLTLHNCNKLVSLPPIFRFPILHKGRQL